jgi:hypothetical protein
MEHWRRAVRWTGAGIFAMALIGGLVGGLTRGSLADAASHAQGHAITPASQTTSSQTSASRTTTTTHSAAVTSKTAALGTAALLRLSDLPTGWTTGNSAASPTRVTPWSSKLAS